MDLEQTFNFIKATAKNLDSCDYILVLFLVSLIALGLFFYFRWHYYDEGPSGYATRLQSVQTICAARFGYFDSSLEMEGCSFAALFRGNFVAVPKVSSSRPDEAKRRFHGARACCENGSAVGPLSASTT